MTVAAQRNETDLEACRWAMLMERGPLSPQQQSEFDRWLATSTRHEGAYHRALAASVHFNRLGALAGGRGGVGGRLPQTVTRRRAIAATMLAIMLMGVGTWLGGEWHPNVRSGEYATDVGEMRRIGLTDSSEIAVNTSSEVRVSYTGNRRALRLNRGEAFLSVVEDISRPFLVYVGQLLVRANGTAFFVRRIDANKMRITVTEGSLEILWNDRANRQPRRLCANQEITVGLDGVLEAHRVTSEEIQDQSAWLSGRIIFSGQPLHEAVREVNRYSHRHLVVEDSKLAQRRIVGVFRAADTQTFLSTLQQGFDVEAVSTGDTVLLHPRVKSQ